MKKKCKIKWVGALRGRWRVDCKKKCKIKRVGALKCWWRVDCEKKCKIKMVGVLTEGAGGGLIAKKVQNKTVGH